MTILPPAPWRERKDLAALIAALGPGQARYVGGAVRDTLLGQPVKDIDVATPLEPKEVMRRLKAHAIQAIPTGIEHGTVTAVLPEGNVEITTLRHDVSTDGRRATVAFAQDWQDDAARRDFTINALYADPASGELFDWFGGLADLEARRVRFIGDAHQRIREDHLRILRYFRFQARFGSQPADAEAELAISNLKATLKGLSRERVGMEMMNLLGLPDPAPTVARMAQLGVLDVVLPEADVAALAALTAEERKQEIAPDALRRLAALLPPEAPLAEAVASRFRLSGAQKKRLALAAGRNSDPPPVGEVASRSDDGGGKPGNTPTPSGLRPATSPTGGGSIDPRALAYRLGRDAALDRLLLAGASVAALKDWQIPAFSLKGGAIVARGVKAGPEVARVLQAVEARWVAEGFPDDTRIAALLDAELEGRK
ncbi:CCA tRNA nucleotidyltransferase [Novosphingobium sp.]|uniref:CCA tRNA nucleotidyltransferase n=1 Tax=Novosphingobium sp. TaxID=1874826 RepID=UPI0025DEE641|nr:CCA tRNA nucleotidyltransferase [Novosphingobium sp.]MCC6926048.1 CCA tRNA nucleotidyltransferase [Novosphingobium sp.]